MLRYHVLKLRNMINDDFSGAIIRLSSPRTNLFTLNITCESGLLFTKCQNFCRSRKNYRALMLAEAISIWSIRVISVVGVDIFLSDSPTWGRDKSNRASWFPTPSRTLLRFGLHCHCLLDSLSICRKFVGTDFRHPLEDFAVGVSNSDCCLFSWTLTSYEVINIVNK
jgi:hypothetical protein